MDVGQIFHHNCVTSFYCIPYKEEREKEFCLTGVPMFTLCNQNHCCCKDNNCQNCCNLNKCNQIKCNYCNQNDKDCICSLSTEQAVYNEINKDVSYICRQYEVTGSGKLHAQMYIQFYTKQTIKSAKILFNDCSKSIPIFLASNLDQNRTYAIKTYNCCKVYSQCRDFFDLSKIYKHCTDLCIHSNTRWGNGNLISDVIGPFEFGTYQFLEGSENNAQEDINDLRLDDLKCIMEIRDKVIYMKKWLPQEAYDFGQYTDENSNKKDYEEVIKKSKNLNDGISGEDIIIVSNLTLSKELFNAQIELREERRKWQEEYEQYQADLEDMKRKIEEIEATALYLVLHLHEVIEEKDDIIQNTIAHYEARINSGYISVEKNEFNKYENLMREMNIDVIKEENSSYLSDRSISEYNDF
ncbi:hypothetical protein F8M41_016520 [Gigaspora margarita]|uniref:CRESS-DNA virus Rep endonuclease domain-containing protein n=1 Tax=Gigaspora margarita TaxID=4874 RepID=A0A8H4AP71_GIGMA|nr:hypothetical protein F8M41_016520 [Gigaspora margarita]